jgi:hypothetical protein
MSGDLTWRTVTEGDFDALLAENERLREALRKLTDQHQRTLTGSRKHDPERILDFRDCPCVTCRTTALLLTEPHTQPCDCAWCRFQNDDAEGAVVHVPQGVCECDAPRCERDGCQDKPTAGGARAAQAIHLLRAVVEAERIERLPGDHAVNVALLAVDEWLAALAAPSTETDA